MRTSINAFLLCTSLAWAGGVFAQSDDGTGILPEGTIPQEEQATSREPVSSEPVSSIAVSSVAAVQEASSAQSSARQTSSVTPVSSSVASKPASSGVAVSSAVSSSVRSSAKSSVRPVSSVVAVRSSIASAHSSTSSALSASSTGSGVVVAGTWDREAFGYTSPVIRPPRFSLSTPAIFGNVSIALAFAVVIMLSGMIIQHLMRIDGVLVRQILRRLPAQFIVTLILFLLLRSFIPTASAQGFADPAAASFLQIPFFALLFFLVVGLSNVLFNNMLVAEGDTIHGFLLSKPWIRKLHREGISKRAWFILILSVLYGLIGGYVNPDFSILPGKEIGILFVTVFTIMVSVYLKDLMAFGISRKWRHPSWFQAHVGGLLIAVICILLTRVFGLDPGYIYGVPAGFLIAEGLSQRREGLMESLGLFWVVILACAVWFAGMALSGYEVPFDIFNLLFVILIEDAFLDMLPLPSLAGEAIFRWKKALWFLQFTLVSFLLFHTLFNPEGTISGLEQSPPALMAVVLLGCYAAGILLLWGYVAWRRRG